MTAEEWILFISFNVVINIVFQVTAWKLSYRLTTNQRKENKNAKLDRRNNETERKDERY